MFLNFQSVANWFSLVFIFWNFFQLNLWMICQKAGILKCVSLDNNYIPSIKKQIQILVPFFTSLTTSAEGFQKFKMSPPHFEIQEH